MSFALTSFFADGVRFTGPGPIRASQKYLFTITAAATDVDLDVGDTTGTFWTEAQADTTYGDLATSVLAAITEDIAPTAQYEAISNIFLPELYDRPVQVASSPTGTEYTAAIDSTTLLPSYEFATSGGDTSYTLVVEYLLQPNLLPKNLAYNVG